MSAPVFVAWCEQAAVDLHGGASGRVLQRWLEGYGLPEIDTYTEAFTWLLEGLAEQPQLKQELLPAAAEILRAHLDRKLKSKEYNRLLFNLFYLCTGMRSPILWRLLWATLKDEVSLAGQSRKASGKSLRYCEYQAVPVLMPFRAALAENQIDDRLTSVWRRMLGEQPNAYLKDSSALDIERETVVDFLDGSPMDGFEGVLGSPGPPQEALIGWALGRMADYLTDSRFRDKQFAELLDSVKARWSTVTWDFVDLYNRGQWPSWTRQLLEEPSDALPVSRSSMPLQIKAELDRLSVPPQIEAQLHRMALVIAIDAARSRLSAHLMQRNFDELVNAAKREAR